MTAEWEKNLRYQRIHPHVIKAEGGYVWDEEDSGGATNFGISFNNNVGILGAYGITSPSQMRYLTLPQALEIYYRKYWVPSQADEIPDIRLAFVYFDHYVNAGPGSANKLLAKLDPKLWFYKGDGQNIDFWWGQTLQFMLHRLWFYTSIRQWGRYGLGWFNRLIKITKAIPKL
jgi:lysozyme family protein